MANKYRPIGSWAGAFTLSAGVLAVSLAPLPMFAQTTESAAFEVARSAQTVDAAIEFITQYPESPLAVELVESLGDDAARALCASLPAGLSQGLIDKCTQLLAIAPAAGPAPAPGTADGQLAARGSEDPGPSY